MVLFGVWNLPFVHRDCTSRGVKSQHQMRTATCVSVSLPARSSTTRIVDMQCILHVVEVPVFVLCVLYDLFDLRDPLLSIQKVSPFSLPPPPPSLTLVTLNPARRMCLDSSACV